MNNKQSKFKTSGIFAIIGFIAGFASFIIALINANYVFAIMFLLAAIYCISHFASCIKNKK